MTKNKPSEEHDLVSVTIDFVEYYGYIEAIDWDMRCPSITVEFFPGKERTFDFNEVTLMNYPTKRVD